MRLKLHKAQRDTDKWVVSPVVFQLRVQFEGCGRRKRGRKETDLGEVRRILSQRGREMTKEMEETVAFFMDREEDAKKVIESRTQIQLRRDGRVQSNEIGLVKVKQSAGCSVSLQNSQGKGFLFCSFIGSLLHFRIMILTLFKSIRITDSIIDIRRRQPFEPQET